MDATASREPTWARAQALHQSLFDAAVDGSSLAVQVCYYRGFSDFQASAWLTDSFALRAYMQGVSCEGGPTQITRLLRHYLEAGTPATPVRAMVFIGDAMEESAATLKELAGQCRLKNQPLFLFQEGTNPQVATTFEQLARLSGGAYAAFDSNSADHLRELLQAVVRYTSGGRKALTSSGSDSDKLLLSQLPGNS